jgi:hypothetical protein
MALACLGIELGGARLLRLQRDGHRLLARVGRVAQRMARRTGQGAATENVLHAVHRAEEQRVI